MPPRARTAPANATLFIWGGQSADGRCPIVRPCRPSRDHDSTERARARACLGVAAGGEEGFQENRGPPLITLVRERPRQLG